MTHALHDDPDVVLCGNKCDLVSRRVISSDRANQMAESLGLSYIEVSAATGANVAGAIELLLESVMRRVQRALEPRLQRPSHLTESSDSDDKHCSC